MFKELTFATRLGPMRADIELVPDTEPVVFLHGMFLNKSIWQQYRSELTDKTHVFLDMPSHGDNPSLESHWTQADTVGAVLDCLKKLGVTRCTLIGHSWGAITALQLAYEHPALVSALGLFNMPTKSPDLKQRFEFKVQKLLGFLPGVYANIFTKACFSADFITQHPRLLTTVKQEMQKRSPKSIARLLSVIESSARNLMHKVSAIKAPVIMVNGVADKTVSHDYATLQRLVALRSTPGGHVSPLEGRETTAQVIQELARKS